MEKGVVKFFNDEKGYGFITNDETGKDVFVHKTGLVDSVREDDHVEYEVEEGPKGLNATNVSRVR
jgi:CspA family cold shock protein